jgi:hypothetical protein
LLIKHHINKRMEQQPIFRFKLNEDIIEMINRFAKIHQFDDRKTYKEEWSKWFNENNVLFEEEISRLTRLGYIGNIEYKMFNAGRYYFRKKNTEEDKKEINLVGAEDKKIKIPRLYISADKNMLDAMDKHIQASLNDDNDKNNKLFTPASGYNDFCKTHTALLSTEIKRIYNTFDNLDLKKEISAFIIQKIKKTYKNRYFIITRK